MRVEAVNQKTVDGCHILKQGDPFSGPYVCSHRHLHGAQTTRASRCARVCECAWCECCGVAYSVVWCVWSILRRACGSLYPTQGLPPSPHTTVMLHFSLLVILETRRIYRHRIAVACGNGIERCGMGLEFTEVSRPFRCSFWGGEGCT